LLNKRLGRKESQVSTLSEKKDHPRKDIYRLIWHHQGREKTKDLPLKRKDH